MAKNKIYTPAIGDGFTGMTTLFKKYGIQFYILLVAGQSDTRNPEFPIPWIFLPENKGNHIIHTGGKYDSYLQIPVIPPKYQAGDYVYR